MLMLVLCYCEKLDLEWVLKGAKHSRANRPSRPRLVTSAPGLFGLHTAYQPKMSGASESSSNS